MVVYNYQGFRADSYGGGTDYDYPIFGVDEIVTTYTTEVAPEPTSTLVRALVLWPLRWDSTPSIRVTTGAATDTLSLGITAGRVYWMSGDGQADADGDVGGVGDFLQLLEDRLNTNTGGGVYSVTITGFRVVITCTVAFSILWSHVSTTLDEAIVGAPNATQPSPAATSYAAPYFPHGIWRPGIPLMKDTRDRQPVVNRVSRALSGLQRTARLLAPQKERDVAWHFIRPEKALTEFSPAGEPTSSLEYAWVNSISYGRPIRLYETEVTTALTITNPVTGSGTIASYGLYRLRDEKDPLIDDQPAGARPLQRWRAEMALVRAD
jgi:hypothetical protein